MTLIDNFINWSKYIDYNEFVSTNGVKLRYKWEFDRLEKEDIDKKLILSCILSIAYPYDILGIATIYPIELERHCSYLFHPKGNIFHHKPEDKYVIYDDVVTTGKTILKCINQLNRRPEKIICLIDRRIEGIQTNDDEGWDLEIISIQQDVLKRRVDVFG